MPMFKLTKELSRAAARGNLKTFHYIIDIMNTMYTQDWMQFKHIYLECARITYIWLKKYAISLMIFMHK